MTQKTQLTEAAKKRRAINFNAGGRQAAWTFVVQSNWNINAIRSKLVDKEESQSDPDFQSGSMAPGASPRLVIDGYIDALKDAISIIEAQQSETVLA